MLRLKDPMLLCLSFLSNILSYQIEFLVISAFLFFAVLANFIIRGSPRPRCSNPVAWHADVTYHVFFLSLLRALRVVSTRSVSVTYGSD